MANQIEQFIFKGKAFRLATEFDVPALRILINSSYAELAAMGLNYTGSYQDEEVTRKRIQSGKAYLLEGDGKCIGTVLLKKENWFTNTNSAYISQLAIAPDLKKQGLGTLLIELCEEIAKNDGFDSIQLDTAKPATHLVSWYQKMGFRIVGETKFDGKTYESWIFEKAI